MSLYGKMMGGLAALALLGGSTAYVAGIGGRVIEAAEQTAAEISCYIVREYNGAPALFRDGEEEPLEVYSTPMEEINPADAAKLAEGIRLRGISEVNRLLEDLEIR